MSSADQRTGKTEKTSTIQVGSWARGRKRPETNWKTMTSGVMIYRGNAPAARFLLDAGAKTDARDRVDWTPLHFAAKDERGLEDRKSNV